MFSTKTALIVATSAAIALASFDMRPAQAAPEGSPAVVKQGSSTDEFSSQRRRRGRGVHPGVPLAAFGALIGTIGAIAAARREREVYYYGGGPYHYAQPYYVEPQYAPQYVEPQYVEPQYVEPAYVEVPQTVYYHRPAPVYRHHVPHVVRHHAPQVFRHHAPQIRHHVAQFRHHAGVPRHHGGHAMVRRDGRRR